MVFAVVLITTLQYLGVNYFSALCCLAFALSPAAKMAISFKFAIFVTFIPLVSAAPQTQPFPNVPFKVFSTFVEKTFSSQVSLATVLLVLFSLTETQNY